MISIREEIQEYIVYWIGNLTKQLQKFMSVKLPETVAPSDLLYCSHYTVGAIFLRKQGVGVNGRLLNLENQFSIENSNLQISLLVNPGYEAIYQEPR